MPLDVVNLEPTATMNRSDSLAPLYMSEIRDAIQDSFLADIPVFTDYPHKGPISSRIARQMAGRGVESEHTPLDLTRTDLSPAMRWVLLAGRRPLIHATLLEIAGSDIGVPEKVRAERRVLRSWSGPQGMTPLSPRLLSGFCQAARVAPQDFGRWLDSARAAIMVATDMDAVEVLRRQYRLRAVALGAKGRWPVAAVSAAELFCDLLGFWKAAEQDVRRSLELAGSFDGSVAAALASIDEDQDTSFENYLKVLAIPALSEADVPPESLDLVKEFSGTRPSLLAKEAGRLNRPTPVEPKRPDPDPGYEVHSGRPADPRARYEQIRDELRERVIGDQAVSSLALIGVAHLEGMGRIRCLLTGESGSGKTHTVQAFAEVLRVPHVYVDANDLSPSGWLGAEISSSIEELERLCKGKSIKGLLHIDEIDKVRLPEGEAVGTAAYNAKMDLMTSLLGVLDGQPVTPAVGVSIPTDRILVIGTGAFEGRFTDRPPTTEELVDWGYTVEFAARLSIRMSLSAPTRDAALDLLRRSDRSVSKILAPLAEALGLELVVPESVLHYAVERWLMSSADFRTAAEWLLEAARMRMTGALDRGEYGRIVLAPDDLERVPPLGPHQ